MPNDEDNKWWQQWPRLIREGLWSLVVFFAASAAAGFCLGEGKIIPSAGVFAVAFLIIAVIALIIFIVRALLTPPLDVDGIKGPSPFIDEEHDAELLNNLGRRSEIVSFRGSALDGEIRLLAMLGKPGSGKSSVLRAGVKWEVQQIAGKEICYWQASPEASIDHLTKTVNGSFTDFQQVWESFLKPPSAEPSSQPVKLDKLRILIMDHFDFLRPDYDPHKVFFDLIERICNDPSPHRVKCVIAFREEYWPHWHAFLKRLKADTAVTVNEVRLAPLHTAKAQVVMHGILTRAGFSARGSALKRFISGLAEDTEIRPVWIQVGSEVLSRWAESSLLWMVSQRRYLRSGGVKGVIAEHLQHQIREVAPMGYRPLLQAVSGCLIDKATGKRNMAGAKIEDFAKQEGLDPVDIRALAATN